MHHQCLAVFDYLIASDDLNRIFVLEAFSMKFEELEFNCNSKIIQLKYDREESLIIAMCDDGSVNFHLIIINIMLCFYIL